MDTYSANPQRPTKTQIQIFTLLAPGKRSAPAVLRCSQRHTSAERPIVQGTKGSETPGPVTGLWCAGRAARAGIEEEENRKDETWTPQRL